jgi:hypothetical protein
VGVRPNCGHFLFPHSKGKFINKSINNSNHFLGLLRPALFHFLCKRLKKAGAGRGRETNFPQSAPHSPAPFVCTPPRRKPHTTPGQPHWHSKRGRRGQATKMCTHTGVHTQACAHPGVSTQARAYTQALTQVRACS